MLLESLYSVEGEKGEGRIYTSSKPRYEPHRIIRTKLDFSVTSSVHHVLRTLCCTSGSNVLATEARNDAGVGTSKSTRRSVRVLLAVVSKSGLALAVRTHAVVQLAWQAGLLRLNNVLENVALSNDLGAGIGLESMLAVGVEVVVDGVEEGVAADLGGAAGGVVNVVTLEGHEVVGASEVYAPVVVAVTGRGPCGCTVDFAVGDGDAVGSSVSEDNVLAGDEIGGDMVDPDKISPIQGDGIASPNVLRVDVGESHVLDNDVLCVGDNANTLALNHTLGALTDQTLVGANGHAQYTSLIVGDALDFGRTSLVVVAPFVLVDCQLASGTCAPRSTSRLGDLAFSSGEVKGLGKNDDTRGRVAQIADELSGSAWVHWRSRATACDAFMKLVTIVRYMNTPLQTYPWQSPQLSPLQHQRLQRWTRKPRMRLQRQSTS